MGNYPVPFPRLLGRCLLPSPSFPMKILDFLTSNLRNHPGLWGTTLDFRAPKYGETSILVGSFFSRPSSTNGGKRAPKWLALGPFKDVNFWYSPENQHVPWKSMVGRCVSYWNTPFLEDMLVFWGVSMLDFWAVWVSIQETVPCESEHLEQFRNSRELLHENTTFSWNPKANHL